MKTKHLKIGKYVIVNNSPILFPVELVHSDVVTSGQSAGFFVLKMNNSAVLVHCWGESTSLRLASDHENDARIIKEFIGNLSSPAMFASINAATLEK